MNARGNKPTVIALTVAAIFGSACTGVAYAEGPIVRWERIEGIDSNASGQFLKGIAPVTFPWSTTRGSAFLNLDSGKLQFQVEGLSMGASPTPVALIGTTGAVAEVKGTIMCNQSGEFVDSDAVELSDGGDAIFSGQLSNVPNCDASDLIFLLRIAAVVPGAPPITNLWLAHGAARNIR